MRSASRRAALGLAAALAAAAAAPATVTIYRAVGAVDFLYGATVVHCTNLGPGPTDLDLRFYDGAGTEVCWEILAAVPAGATRTLASRYTFAFNETAACQPEPELAGGALAIGVDDASAERVLCTVQVVDVLHPSPIWAEKLPLFNRDWIPLSELIFESGFEPGSTIDWNLTAP